MCFRIRADARSFLLSQWGQTGDGSTIGLVYGAYILPWPLQKYSLDYIFVRAHGKRLKFGTACGHHISITPLGLAPRGGKHTEATAVRLVAESDTWRLEWTHRMHSSAVNPGGRNLELIVWEQLSFHNLTLTSLSNTSAAPFATLVNVPGFTEWSNPL